MTRLPNLRFRKPKRKISKKISRRKHFLLNCRHKPTGIKILELLSQPLSFHVGIWRDGRLIHEFEPDINSNRIDVEFCGGLWRLKDSKFKNFENCLIQLLAKASDSNAGFLRCIVQDSWDIPRNIGARIVIVRDDDNDKVFRANIDYATWMAKRFRVFTTRDTQKLLDDSQYRRDLRGRMVFPRSAASWDEKPQFQNMHACWDCIENKSLGCDNQECSGFLTFYDQEYFLFKTLRKSKIQNLIRWFCCQKLEELKLYIPIEWIFDVINWKDYVPRHCGIWINGEFDRREEIFALILVVTHRYRSTPWDATPLLISQFYPFPKPSNSEVRRAKKGQKLPQTYEPVIIEEDDERFVENTKQCRKPKSKKDGNSCTIFNQDCD